MAINLTGLIPLRYLSCVSAAKTTLRLTQTGIAAHAHKHTTLTAKHIQTVATCIPCEPIVPSDEENLT